MAGILYAKIKGCLQNDIPLPRPFLPFIEKLKRGEAITEDLNRLIEAHVVGFENAICRGMTKGKMGLNEFMERIHAGDVEVALQYIRFFRKPLDTDPDFEAIRKKMVTDPDLMSKISKAFKTPRSGYPHYMGALALLASLCKDEIESGKMSIKEFQDLAKRCRAIPKSYGKIPGEMVTAKEDIDFEDTENMRKQLHRMGIKRPKK